MDKQILTIVSEARMSISSFCINECKSLCCKTNYLILLNDIEINIIVGKKKNLYLKNSILKPSKNGNYLYDLTKAPCKHLTKKFECKIHSNLDRPKVCSDFPIFIVKNYIITSESCPAVKEGYLNNYIKKLEKLGLKSL